MSFFLSYLSSTFLISIFKLDLIDSHKTRKWHNKMVHLTAVKDIMTVTMAICVVCIHAAPPASPLSRQHRHITGMSSEPCAVQMTPKGNQCTPNNMYRVIPPGFHCVYNQKLNSCFLKCIGSCNKTVKRFYMLQIEAKKRKQQLLKMKFKQHNSQQLHRGRS